MDKPGRNDLCPCGSGKKFKRCCLTSYEPPASAPQDPPSAAPALPDEPVAYFDEIDEISNRTLDLIEEGRLDEAQAACQQLLAEFPDMPDGFMRMAALHEARGQRQEAATCYRKAADIQLRADPTYGHELADSLRAQAAALEAGASSASPPRATDTE